MLCKDIAHAVSGNHGAGGVGGACREVRFRESKEEDKVESEVTLPLCVVIRASVFFVLVDARV